MTIPGKISTGVRSLDEDLRVMFKTLAGSKRQAVVKVLRNPKSTEEEISAVVPIPLLRAAYALTTTHNFEGLLKQCSDEVHPLLRQAREVAKRHFPRLSSHPGVEAILAKVVGVEEEKPRLNLNVISRIAWRYQWEGKPPKLLPIVRIGFRDKRETILLDTSMDWDDLLYVVNTLTKILGKQFEHALALAQPKLLELPDKEQLGERIAEMQTHLDRVVQAAPKLGIKLKPQRRAKANEAAGNTN